MKEMPKFDPSRVGGGGLLPPPCTDPPYLPTRPPLVDPVPKEWPDGPDQPYEGPTF